MSSRIESFDHGIFAIDTNYVRSQLDASHLILSCGHAAFVDTGVASSVPHLLAALDTLGIRRDQVDYVLLTHVHLDHAGGAGLLMQSLPQARAVVHPRGARHMIDPAKLIAGSIAVYGEQKFRELYGEIVPIAESRVLESADGMRLQLGVRDLEFIHTPGHASHHYCIHDQEASSIFSGDTFGISYREFDTARGAFIFPTTTPVQFDPSDLHASINRLMTYQPEAMFLTHYSRVSDVARLAGDLHADLDTFVEIARSAGAGPDSGPQIRKSMYEHLEGRLARHGVRLSATQIHDVLALDVDLNAQGLEFWLHKQTRQPHGGG